MPPPTAAVAALHSMEAALRREGRGFGPNGAGAPIPPPKPTPVPPREIRDGEILLGHASNHDAIGLGLVKLIDGRLLIQGNSGAGKSTLLRLLFEQAFGKVQLLLLDRDGEFSTLAEILDVAVFTSANILRIGGEAFARHLREHRYSAIVDLSDATSEDAVATAADIATGLVEAPAEHWHPLLVLVDEAQTLVPRYDPGDVEQETRKRCIRALADLMGRGRKRGLAGIITTGRIAETSTPVVSKATNVIVGRTVFDRDVDRCGNLLGFTAGQSRPLRTLADGEFIGIGPALGAGRVRFRAGAVRSRHKGKAPDVVAPPTISASAAAELLRQVPEASAGYEPPVKTEHRGSGRYWSEPEDRIIRDGYANTTKLKEIAQQLAGAGYRERSVAAVCTRARALGLESKNSTAKGAWTPDEDEILIAGYTDPDVKIMDIVGMLAAAGFDRQRVSVQMRAIALGVTRDRVNYYKEEETAIAKAGLEAGKSNSQIIADLRAAGYHRGVTSISKFAQKHGYDRSAEPWTPEQIDEMATLYKAKTPVREIAEKLGKPIAAIRSRASNMGLKQRVGWTDQEYERLQALWRDGKTLTQAVQQMGRPYPNVARIALSLGLNFSILPTERGKAVALQKVGRATATAPVPTKEMRKTPAVERKGRK
jgi:hypothetical protein